MSFARTVFLLSICAGLLPAQSGATIGGTVLDQAGKTVPNAQVTLRSESGDAVREVKTGDDGHFSASGLNVGKYTVEVSAPGFSVARRMGVDPAGGGAQELSIALAVGSVNQSVTVEEVVSLAAQLAPSGNTLDATSARTEISKEFIQNFTSPVSDFSEVLNMAPGTVSVNSNGVGLGQGKTFFRGFKDGLYSMTYDGIPFQDTNDPTHHSWAFFPAQWIGGTDFDRSPGLASTMGPSNVGGSINLLSQDLQASPDFRASASYGSFNTRLFDLSLDSGQFDPGKKSSLFIDVHQLLSDGYQTYIVIGHGVSLYMNGTLGIAKYQQTGLWVANAPHDTEAVGLSWQQKNWNVAFFNKRVGKMYNDYGNINQGIPIDPFNVSNIYINYTIKNASILRGSKLGLSVNNLFDNHNITGITPGSTAAPIYAPSGGDFLTLLPGRSVMVSLTVGYAPKR